MTKNDNTKQNTTSEQTEQVEKQKNTDHSLKWTSQEELFDIISEEFDKYVENLKDNKDFFKWKSYQDIFLTFLKTEENYQKILEVLKEKLWHELTFEDIKYFYLKCWYTLQENITKKIFKQCKEEYIIVSVVKKFNEKIKNKLEELNEQNKYIDIVDCLPTKIEERSVIDQIFECVRWKFEQIISNLPENKKEQLENIKITNEEIINQIFQDKIINEEEYKFLKWDITQISQKSKEKVLNIQSTLLNSNIVNTYYDFEKIFDQINIDFEKMYEKLPTLWDLFDKYKELNEDDKKWIFEQIKHEQKDFNQDNIEESIKKWLWKLENIEKLLSRKNPKIWEIYRKIVISNDDLTNEDWNFIINETKEIFIDNFIEQLDKKLDMEKKLTQEQKENLCKMLDELLNPHIDYLTLPDWTKISNIQKEIIYPKRINERPIIKWIISDNNIEYVKWAFKEKYFVNIKWQDFSKFSKIKIKTKDQKEYTWYIEEWEIDQKTITPTEILLLTHPEYDSSQTEEDLTINKIDIKDIESVEYIEEPKLILHSETDLKDIVQNIANYIVPEYFDTEKSQKNNIHEIENISKQGDNTSKQEDITNDNETTDKNNLWKNIEKNTNLEAFKKKWADIEWDTKVEFEKWATLMLQWDNLKIPWIACNWYQAKIINIDRENWFFEIKLIWWWIIPLEWEWKVIKLPIHPDIIEKILQTHYWNVIKIKNIKNIKNFWEYLKQINLKSDHKSLQTWLEKWKNIKIKNWKIFKVDKDGKETEIKYIWRLLSWNYNNNEMVWENNSYIFEIKVLKFEMDILTHPHDKNFKKEIDLNTLLIIVWTNKLEPWDEKMFKHVQVYNNTKPWTTEDDWINILWLRFKYSFTSITTSFKQVIDNIKYYFKEEDDFRAVKMYENFTKIIPNWWVFGEVKMEAWGERESKIMKKIQNAKARLQRVWDDKWWTHWSTASKIIEQEIFSCVKKWKKLSYKRKLKAAWYLLYALEWWWPYFRALRNYGWDWYWIKALLWDEHYDKWKDSVEILNEKIKHDPTNQDLREKLVLSEMFYLKDELDIFKLYWRNFWAEIENYTLNKLYSSWKVENVYKWEANKWSYDKINDGIKAYILNKRPTNALWWLKALTERIEDYNLYIDYNRVISSFILTWFLYHNFDNKFREDFDKICRTYTIPFGLFAKEYNGINKVLKLFDYICKIKWLKPWWKKTLTEYLYWIKDPDNVDILDNKFQNGKFVWEIYSKLEEFWWTYWETFTRVLDYSDPILINYKFDNDCSDDTKKILDEYFTNHVNCPFDDNWAYEWKLFKTADFPYYQDWVFNISKVVFVKNALKLVQGDFEWSVKWIWKWIWKAISNKLKYFENSKYTDSIYEFVLKKFMLFMWRLYQTEEDKKELIDWLLSKNREKLEKIIIQKAKDHFWFNWKIPIEMELWLKSFVDFFLNVNPSNIKELLNQL